MNNLCLHLFLIPVPIPNTYTYTYAYAYTCTYTCTYTYAYNDLNVPSAKLQNPGVEGTGITMQSTMVKLHLRV